MGVLKISGNEHPSKTANPISRVLLVWTRKIFWKAYKGTLEEEDLCDPIPSNQSELLSGMLEKNWLKEIQRAKEKRTTPSLLRAIFKTFWLKFVIYGTLCAFDNGICRTVIPFLVGKMVTHFTHGSELPTEEAYFLAVGMVFSVFLNVILKNHYTLWCGCIGMKVRVACSSLIYQKVLRLNKYSMGQTATGNIVNLMSNDVSRFDLAGQYFHWIWVCLVQAIITTACLWYLMGVSSVIGMAAIILTTVPVQGYLGKVAAKLRRRIALLTDKRMRLMTEIISGIQVIKMYAWEKPFAELAATARKNEINVVTLAAYVRAVLLSAIAFSERISLFAALLSYWMYGNSIKPHQIFALSIYMNFMNISLALYYPMGVSGTAEALVSVKRVQDFLLKDESSSAGSSSKVIVSPGIITLSQVNAKWTDEHHTLDDINLEVAKGKLCAVIGPVGAGKSSLLHLLLGELPPTSGMLGVGGKVVYSAQESWIFMGTVRENILFGQPFNDEKYKEVVRVCALKRDFVLLPNGDETVIGGRGIALSGGQRARINLARAVYQDADIYLLDDPLSAVDTVVGKRLFDECINGYLKKKTRILVTHQLQYLHKADIIANIKHGKIVIQDSVQEMLQHDPALAEIFKNHEKSKDEEEEKSRLRVESVHQRVLQEKNIFSSIDSRLEGDAASNTKTKFIHYWQYFRAGAGPLFMGCVICTWVLTQATRSIADYWMRLWSDAETGRNQGTNRSYLTTFDTKVYILVYGILVVACGIITMIRSMSSFKLCMIASKRLHDTMFKSILRATMYFFSTNPSGIILNCFSKDVGAMDEQLPNAFIWMCQVFTIVIGVYVVIAVTNYFLIIPMVISWIIIILVIKYMIEAPRRLKVLEARTRSPMFAYLSDSINGLATIRASKSQEAVQRIFHSYQDVNTSASFWFLSASITFGFYLDLIVAIFIALATFTFFIIGSEHTAGSEFGLAVYQALQLTGMLQTGILQMTEVVSQMNSVSRVLGYTNLESEPALESDPDKKPPADWPSMGKIQLQDVSMKYSAHGTAVLKNLNFMIQERHKVGVVGRTGAGKSSLLSLLFRLANVEGTVLIDTVDTGTIGLHDLRKKISIIPQEPVLFSATMRYNLDPFNEFEDDALWSALEEVELKSAVNSLDRELSEGGSNLSVGQRQLVCLARAILRNCRILVLDEATANVDPETDALIQRTIRVKFKDCTVLTIAHRLNTIMDSDRVLVMDAGTLVEYDHPYNLLRINNGHFFKMVQETGTSMAEYLTSIAQKEYLKSEEKELEL